MTSDAMKPDALAVWRAGGQAGDARACATALADDVVLVSPLTDRFTFVGRAEVETLLVSVFEVVTDIQYTMEFHDAHRAVLIATGTVRGLSLEEVQLHELDDEGRICRVTMVMRPLPAVTAVLRELGPRVARSQHRPRTALVLRVAGAALDKMASSGDRTFVPLASPERMRTATRGAMISDR